MEVVHHPPPYPPYQTLSLLKAIASAIECDRRSCSAITALVADLVG